MRAFEETGVSAVIATNTLAMPAPDGTTAGVSGGRLHRSALEAVAVLAAEKAQHGYALDIIACGGVSDGATYRAFEQHGVRAMQYYSTRDLSRPAGRRLNRTGEPSMTSTQQVVAETLLDIGNVVFTPDAPVTFKSGIVAPVYVDNRRLPFEPEAWHRVIDVFQAEIAAREIDFDVIAGIEAGGIPHSAALAYVLRRPSVFVRKQPKEHGMKRRVEGGEVTGKRVLLIEDLVTTGGSSLSGVEALRDEGATVIACMTIFSYGFPQAVDAFRAADLPLITLTTLPALIDAARERGSLSPNAIEVVQDWSDRVRSH